MRKKNLQKEAIPGKRTWITPMFAVLIMAVGLSGCQFLDDLLEDTNKDKDKNKFPLMELPQGFKVEKLAEGLHLPTSVTWDDQGKMYVVEAGGGLFPEQLAPMRILQIKENGAKVVVADLSNSGIQPSIVGLVWHQGYFYFTHRAKGTKAPVSTESLLFLLRKFWVLKFLPVSTISWQGRG